MRAPSRPDGMRRSRQVALVLLGTTGVVGLAMIADAWIRTADESPDATALPPTPVSTDRTYANNEYIPGVGYYHAAYRAWYPFPFNYYVPARGYFAGGMWQAAPWIIGLSQSRPSDTAVQAALTAQRRRQQEQQSRGAGGYVGHGGGAWFSPSSSAPAETGHSGVMRGGFGGSAHGIHGGGA